MLAALLALPLTSAEEATGQEPAPPSGAAALAEEGAQLRAARATLLDRIARLTDLADGAHARFVAAQQRLAAAEAAMTAAGAALAEHAVEAFVHSGSLTAASRARGGVFAEVVVEADRAVVDAVRVAATSADRERGAAETALTAARDIALEVASARRSLEATIAAHEERTAAALAEEARNAAARRLAEEERAREEEEEEQARGEAARQEWVRREADEEATRAMLAASTAAAAAPADPHGPPTGGGATPRQRDRTARVTSEQAELLARHPFGPVPGLPPGAVRTGAVVEGMASWYGPGFDGRPTATGALFDQEGWTVASKELPLGTVLLVTRGDRAVLALVNDRGPFVAGRVLDLSRAVAAELGTIHAGVAHVRAEVVQLP